MHHMLAMYDSPLFIQVPPEKARAVVEAMERDMQTLLATKQDVDLLRKDIETASLSLKLWLGGVAIATVATTVGFLQYFLG